MSQAPIRFDDGAVERAMGIWRQLAGRRVGLDLAAQLAHEDVQIMRVVDMLVAPDLAQQMMTDDLMSLNADA